MLRRAALSVVILMAVSAHGVAHSAGMPLPVSAAVTSPLSISVSGGHLVDATGGVVELRGVDRSGTEYACVQGWGIFDGPNDAASVAAIAAWHVNAVRIPLNEDCWLGINGVNPAYSGENYRSAIAAYVSLLESYRIYPILDLHWTAPGTASATGQEPMPDQDHTPAFWSSVASAYKDDHAVIFDLFNEPYPDNNEDSPSAWTCWRDGGTCPAVTYQTAGMQQLVTTVRAAGARNVLMLGGLEYSNDLTGWLTYEPSDPDHQLAASYHSYQGTVCSDVACWNSEIAPVAAHVPVITGEFGETDGTAQYVAAYLPWADAHGVSYLGWTWDVWGCGDGNVLISSYDGTPCDPFGSAVQERYAAEAGTTSSAPPGPSPVTHRSSTPPADAGTTPATSTTSASALLPSAAVRSPATSRHAGSAPPPTASVPRARLRSPTVAATAARLDAPTPRPPAGSQNRSALRASSPRSTALSSVWLARYAALFTLLAGAALWLAARRRRGKGNEMADETR